MWNAALERAAAETGSRVAKGGEGSGCTSLFLTGVDKKRRQQPIRRVFARVM